MKELKGKIVVYKDGSHNYYKNGVVWEFEADPDYLVTLDVSEEGLNNMEYTTDGKEKSKVNIRKSGGGYLIEITNTPIDQTYAVSRDELEQKEKKNDDIKKMLLFYVGRHY